MCPPAACPPTVRLPAGCGSAERRWVGCRWVEHPCFDHEAHRRYARLHVPVAGRCNIRCAFCARQVGGRERLPRPGHSASLLGPAEALRLVAETARREPRLRVVGVAGPGEPLANLETYETLALVRRARPDLLTCLCTNGLLLPAAVPALVGSGLSALSVTVNAVQVRTASQLYEGVDVESLLANQLEGLKLAARAGLPVKVNSVLVPGLNDGEIPEVARLARERGAVLHNVMPLIPSGRMATWRAPEPAELESVRSAAGRYLAQFRACRQCRADASGVPGEERAGAVCRAAAGAVTDRVAAAGEVAPAGCALTASAAGAGPRALPAL